MSEYDQNDRRPGEVTYYVSVGIEKNSRSVNTSAKASVWYTSVLTSFEDDAEQLKKAQTIATSAAWVGANVLEQMAYEAPDHETLMDFREAVQVVARDMIARRLGSQEPSDEPVIPTQDDEDYVPF